MFRVIYGAETYNNYGTSELKSIYMHDLGSILFERSNLWQSGLPLHNHERVSGDDRPRVRNQPKPIALGASQPQKLK